jgi:hypothetical protein
MFGLEIELLAKIKLYLMLLPNFIYNALKMINYHQVICYKSLIMVQH